MTPFKEFEGKTIDSAVKLACEELNTSTDQLKYEVVSYGSTGIFGIVGAKKAKIRVDIPKVDTIRPPDVLEGKDRQFVTDLVAETFQVDAAAATDTPAVIPPETEAAREKGLAVLERIVAAITEGTTIGVDHNSHRILYNVEGGNSAVLIGRRGQTLEAIQYIVEKTVNKDAGSRVRVQVDVEGYLANRRSNLRGLAERMAEKSKRTGKPITLGQMNAHDRRVVHLALKDDSEVRTQSKGEGFYRKLVIFPKRLAGRKRRPRQP
jgi:spoIIIJ-associated protein